MKKKPQTLALSIRVVRPTVPSPVSLKVFLATVLSRKPSELLGPGYKCLFSLGSFGQPPSQIVPVPPAPASGNPSLFKDSQVIKEGTKGPKHLYEAFALMRWNLKVKI